MENLSIVLQERLAAAARIRGHRTNENFFTTKRTLMDLFESISERDRAISRAMDDATTVEQLAAVIIRYSVPQPKSAAYAFRYRGKAYRAAKLIWDLFYPDNPVGVGPDKDTRFVIIPLDGDPSNLDPFNLMKITKQEFFYLKQAEDAERKPMRISNQAPVDLSGDDEADISLDDLI